MFDDYVTIVFKAKYEVKHRKGLKILKVKAKASNTSENLLNEIRQIIYSLYQAKEINKKIYNNIMNSIML